MKHTNNNKGFTLLEIMAAMLLLSLAYVAILESFSASLSQISRLDRHYGRLLKLETTVLSTPLIFPGIDDNEPEGELYLEGSRYKLIHIKANAGAVETLALVANH